MLLSYIENLEHRSAIEKENNLTTFKTLLRRNSSDFNTKFSYKVCDKEIIINTFLAKMYIKCKNTWEKLNGTDSI